MVVPAYNEAESLPRLYAELTGVLAAYDYEILVVDDGSTDGSGALLARLAAHDPRLRVIAFARRFGKSQALNAGFCEARGRVVITLDADLQDDPAEIPRFLAAIESGADLVSGWKVQRQDPWTKTVPSRVFNVLARTLTGVPLHDINCGYKAYSRRLVDRIDVYGEQHRVIPAVAWWQGFRVEELPVHHRPRLHGRSKFGAWRFLAGILDLVTVMFLARYNRKPLHLFGLVGLVLTLAGLAISGYMAVLRFQGEAIGSRPALLLGVLLLVMGLQFVTMGLLGEIVTAHAGRNRPGVVYRVIATPAAPAAPAQPAAAAPARRTPATG